MADNDCLAETCRFWTGQGCLCGVMGIEPEDMEEHDGRDNDDVPE